MAITYEHLFEILRKEKNYEDLQKLESNFFAEVATYVEEKAKKLSEKPRLDDFTSNENEQNAIRTQLQNIRKIIRDIFDRRERKIIEMASNKAKTGSNIIDTTALLPDEEQFFQDQVNTIMGFRKDVLDPSLTGQKSSRMAVEAPAAEYKPKDLNMAPNESNISDLKKVHILESVPKFVGVDLEIYGPFNATDEVELNPEIAEMLIKTNKAKTI